MRRCICRPHRKLPLLTLAIPLLPPLYRYSRKLPFFRLNPQRSSSLISPISLHRTNQMVCKLMNTVRRCEQSLHRRRQGTRKA